jgi:hypothetical protein
VALLKGNGENKLLGRNVENVVEYGKISINITTAISEK